MTEIDGTLCECPLATPASEHERTLLSRRVDSGHIQRLLTLGLCFWQAGSGPI